VSTAPQRPTVRLFVLCAEAALDVPESLDLSDGWWELRNCLHTVWMPTGMKGGFGAEELYVYVQLTGGRGQFNFGIAVEELDLLNPRRDRVVGRSEPISITFENEWEVVEETFRLLKVAFPRPGQYRFSLSADGSVFENGECYLRVKPGDDS
jgi:hypothetical protein